MSCEDIPSTHENPLHLETRPWVLIGEPQWPDDINPSAFEWLAPVGHDSGVAPFGSSPDGSGNVKQSLFAGGEYE
jgi:hypothetical protein